MAKDQVQITFKVFNEDFKKAMGEMRESTTRLNREFRLQKEQMKLTGSETDKLKAQVGYLNDRYKQSQERVKATEEQLAKAKKTFGENSDEVKKLEAELMNARIEEQRFANQLQITSQSLKEAESKALQFSKAMRDMGQGMQEAGKKISDTGKTLTTRLTLPIVGAGVAAGKMSIDFESAFAGVKKTVDGTEGQLKKLETGIRDMAKEIPASATAIAGVAEAAGQLGIETDNVLGFTRTMIDLGESTNMSADTAATSFAKFANIVGMSQNDFDRLGSSVVALGNNLATTESDIVAMGMGLAGAGSQIGLTEAQIMGFAGALSSVGIEAQAGGSAFSKVMIEMQLATETNSKKLKDFAKVAGMSSKDFKKAFQEDAAGAMIAFIQGLGDAEKQGKSAIKILDDMGIKEVRLRDALLRASGASDVFTDSIELGSKAWEENTALAKEAEQRYETTESKLQVMKNRFVDIGMQLGDRLMPLLDRGLDMIQGWTDKLDNLSPAQMDNIIKIGMMVAAIGPLLIIIGKTVSILGGLFTAIGTISGAIGVVTTGAAAATPAIGALAGAFTFLTGPIGIAVLALGAVTAGGIALVKHLKKDSIPAVELFGDGVSEATEKAVGGFLDLNDQATVALKELSWSGKEVTKEMADGIVGNFSQMSTQVQEKLDEQHTESLSKMQEFMAASKTLSDEEKEQTLNNMIEGHEQKKQTIADGEARIKEIMEQASAEKRALSRTEQEEINSIQQNMVDTGIQVLSENEVEAKLIMERMKESAGQMSALQAAEVVQNSLEQRDGAIKAAEEQYDEVMREIIRQRDEAGTISSEQAEKLIDEAKRQRDEVVKKAESMHDDVVAEAQAQAAEHAEYVDWESGEVKSKWDVMWEKTKETTKNIKDQQVETWKAGWEATKDYWGDMADTVKTKLADMRDATRDKMADIKEKIANSKLGQAWDKVWNFKLPTIKMPKFEWSGEFGINPPSVPKFSVKWASEGAIFKRPTLLGVGDAYRGTGRGMEAVLPISKLADIIADVMPIQEAQPAYATTINFYGNYTFRDRDDIDYFLNEAELRAKRRGI